jgi:uncharacterized protein (DUF1800 family)
VLALNRFGMGPRPGSVEAIAADPREALIAELEHPPAYPAAAAALPSSAKAYRTVVDANAKRQSKVILAKRANEQAKQQQMGAAPAMAETSQQGEGDAALKAAAEAVPDPGRQIYLDEAKLRIEAALTAPIGFSERLVWFWSNHFCISAVKIRSMSGAYEREAIRPHVLGRFADMLLAAESHPAMLVYLDNAQSMGPSSVAGINNNRGLNENLAREILELHTLGVRTVYSQDDVTSFAKVITGWTILPTNTNPEHGGEFIFHPRRHEPGAQTVLGKSYRDTGIEQGRAVLKDLARHAATARHIATKLARHFVADEPPPTLVERLEKKFIETEGDLWQVSKELASAPESWSHEQAKIKRPAEWYVAMRRATGLPVGDGRLLVSVPTRLGEPLWRPPAPKGFADDNGAWLDGLAHRLDSANAFAQSAAAERLDPAAVMETALGPLATSATRQAVARAESKSQALTFVLMAPEFLRR